MLMNKIYTINSSLEAMNDLAYYNGVKEKLKFVAQVLTIKNVIIQLFVSTLNEGFTVEVTDTYKLSLIKSYLN
jgi:hypothetical protein